MWKSANLNDLYVRKPIFVTESLASKLATKAKNETFVPDTPEPIAASKKSPVKPPFKTKAKVGTVGAKMYNQIEFYIYNYFAWSIALLAIWKISQLLNLSQSKMQAFVRKSMSSFCNFCPKKVIQP